MSRFPTRLLLAVTLLVPALAFARHDSADAPAPKAPQLEVGTFNAGAPYGIAMLVDRAVAFSIEPKVVFPKSRFSPGGDEAEVPYGTMAPDGSYFTNTFTVDGAHVSFTWGKLNGHTVGAVISTDHPVTLPFTLTQPWSGCKALYWQDGGHILGQGIAASTGETIPIQIHTQPAMGAIKARYQYNATFSCALDPSKPTILVASTGEEQPPSDDSVAATLAAAGRAYQASRISAEGDWGNFVSPIADTMNGTRLYSSLDRRVAHVVGRGWWIFHQGFIDGNPDYGPFFGWDSCFNANLASLEDPATAEDTIRGVLSYQSPDGMIANYSHWPANGEFVSVERGDPPVGALCVWKLYQRQPDRHFLAEVYPRLVKWHDWWHLKRARPGDFLLGWGGSAPNMQFARWETGWDDTQSFAPARFRGTVINVYCVDLNSLWAMDAENLAHIATALGRTADAARFRAEHARMIKEINDRLWNEKLGLYCNRMWDNNSDGSPNFLTRITPMNFYPLICGAPDAARAKRVLDYLHRPDKFWGQWMIPTLPYDDPDWHRQEYWNGHVWAPVNYLLWQGLVRYDDPAHLAEFARRSVNLFMKGWNTPNRFTSENYRSDTGAPDDDPHYTWGALLPLIGVESLVDISPDLQPVPRQLGIKENIVLHHIPIGGKPYRIENKNGSETITPE